MNLGGESHAHIAEGSSCGIWCFVGRVQRGNGAKLERSAGQARPSSWVATCRSGARPVADSSWKGWWGDNPPYHAETFVLTHYEREPLVMEGGTTFHFVNGGIEEALRLAKQAAGDKDVKIGGGVSTVRQYLEAGLIDSLHFALAAVVLVRGEALFTGLDLAALGFSVTQHKATELATHFVLEKG
jgi:dihydrofolate reductase